MVKLSRLSNGLVVIFVVSLLEVVYYRVVFCHYSCLTFTPTPVIYALRVSDLGCHLGDVYVGCIAYADDIILLLPSLINLPKILKHFHHILTVLSPYLLKLDTFEITDSP